MRGEPGGRRIRVGEAVDAEDRAMNDRVTSGLNDLLADATMFRFKAQQRHWMFAAFLGESV